MQAARVVNVRDEEFDIYIGRACRWFGLPQSKWANPFKLRKEDGELDRLRVIVEYEAWIQGQPELLAALPELTGKRLGCWCHPKFCHGDVLIRLLAERGLL